MKLAHKQDNGATYGEALAHVAPHSISARLELEALQSRRLPYAAADAWQAFLSLSAHRSTTGFGPAPITWVDIDAWQRVTGEYLLPVDRNWVFELDLIYLKDASDALQQRQGKGGKR